MKNNCMWCGNSFKPRKGKRYCSDNCGGNDRRQKEIDRLKSLKFYYLYYIPEEHYVGVTNDPKRRMQNHRAQGKVAKEWEIILKSKNPKLVAYYEALLHLIGYEGSSYDRMIKSRINTNKSLVVRQKRLSGANNK